MVEIYVLPKETLSIGKLQTRINELTNQINSHELGETEIKAKDLLSQRAELVTQLMYTISALLTVKMNEVAVQIKDSIAQARRTGITTQLEDKVQKVQSFYSVLEVYSVSTQEVMTLFRKDFSHVITDDFLGELNVKLYQAINLNTQDLPVQEKISGGGMLSDRLTTLRKRLKPLFDFSISDLDSLQLTDEETEVTEDDIDSLDISQDNENAEETLESDDQK